MAKHEITYRLEEDDFRALARYIIHGTRRGQRIIARSFTTSIIMLGLGATILYYATYNLVFTALLTAACALAFRYLRKANMRTLVERVFQRIRPTDPSRMETPTTVALTPEALEAQHGKGRGRIPWTDVSDLGSDEDHIFFVLGRENAFVVPKRDFPTHEAFTDFLRQAQSYRAQAQGIPTTATEIPPADKDS